MKPHKKLIRDAGTFQEMWMQLARAIETAHGITAAQNGGKHGTD